MNTELTYSFCGVKKEQSRQGDMLNKYAPFNNLIPEDDNKSQEFTTNKLSIDKNHPVEIEVVPEYDGSVNLILNDDEHSPRLINSRFSIGENNTFSIPDRRGFNDTSFYHEDNLESDTQLYRAAKKIPKLDFNGLEQNGRLLCGSYTFYFTLADDDDNETDFVAESGVVMVHMGDINSPRTIRMGMQDERTDKSISFTLSNIDITFKYVRVYYARTTSSDAQADIHSYFKIIDKYDVSRKNDCVINIYGNEQKKAITPTDLFPLYNLYSAAKTHAVLNNRLFLGNVYKEKLDKEEWEDLSRHFVPKFVLGDSIGSLGYNYTSKEYDDDTRAGYYNAKNIYYRTGYWPEEYYRFGVVYIMNDGSCSQVYDILGVNQYILEEGVDPDETIVFDQDGYYKDYINKFGISRAPKVAQEKMLSQNGRPLAVEITYNNSNDIHHELLKRNCIGYFFVRQQRQPITVAQGVVIGKTTHDFGDWPVIKNYNGNYFAESFLSEDLDDRDPDNNGCKRVMRQSYVKLDDRNVETKALIVPEANLREPVYNDLFCKRDFNLVNTCHISQFNQINTNKLIMPLRYDKCDELKNIKSTLVSVNPGIKLTTNGEDYFSSMAGLDIDVTEFKSVLHDWKHEGQFVKQGIGSAFQSYDQSNNIVYSLSQDRLIRGYSGGYTGISTGKFNYGDIVSIKDSKFEETIEGYKLKEQLLKNDTSGYYAVSERYSLSELNNIHRCYRGDCFICNYTQRMMRNFVDPDLPLSNRILDGDAWDKNFIVLSKGNSIVDGRNYFVNEVLNSFKLRYFWHANPNPFGLMTFTQCRKHGRLEGVKYDDNGNYFENLLGVAILSKVMAILTGFISSIIKKAREKSDTAPNSTYSEIFVHKDKSSTTVTGLDNPMLSLKVPGDAQYERAGNALELLGMPNPWEERGIHKINRSDVNNVQLGHWFTVRVLSNYNLNMRDTDIYHAQERAMFNAERSFYPLRPLDRDNQFKIAESKLINGGANVYMPERPYVRPKEQPFTRQEFETRIVYSNVDTEGSFKNGYRYSNVGQYCDYDKQYGSITKLLSYDDNLVAITEHGALLIPVNERVVSGQGAGGSVYINSSKVLGSKPAVISSTYGSIWRDSVLRSPATDVIYGVDTSAKKIWSITRGQHQCISDLILGRFLNENIDLSEWDKFHKCSFTDVRTHYNASKHEVIFVFYHNDLQWSLTYNEMFKKFTSFNTWAPSFSENINNVFFSFDLEDTRNIMQDPYEFWPKDENGGVKNNVSIDDQNVIRYEIELKDWANSNIKHLDHIKNQIDYRLSLEDKRSWTQDQRNKFAELYAKKYCTCPVEMSVDYNVSDIELFTIDYQEKNFEQNDMTIFVTLTPKPNIDRKFVKLYFTDQEKIWSVRLPLRKENCKLWKHSQFGNYEGAGEIKPTNWYGKQEPFEVEFVVNQNSQNQKLFNNLWIISNRVKPEEFEIEIDGDSYDFFKYKKIIQWANDTAQTEDELKLIYVDLLLMNQSELQQEYGSAYPRPEGLGDHYVFKTLPYIKTIIEDKKGQTIEKFKINTTDTVLVEDKLMNQNRIRVIQKSNDIATVGRVAGNTQYIEDNYYVELRNMTVKDAYIDSTGLLRFRDTQYPKIRDKYAKIRIKYSGKDLVVIQQVIAMFDFSYA